MDSIINKLTEIESAASAIVQHAEAEKSALDEKFDKKRMDFDKELEADTQRQIQGIRDKLESETSRILSGQSQESQDELDALQKEYDEKHSDYAHEIVSLIWMTAYSYRSWRLEPFFTHSSRISWAPLLTIKYCW